MRRFPAALALLALPACSGEPASQPSASASSPAAVEIAPAAAKPAGCGDAIPVALDPQGFEAGVETPFPSERLRVLEQQATAAFRHSAAAACAKVPKAASEIGAIKSLTVVPGAGATEPVFYRDAESSPRLNFQYAFIESDLALPKQSETDLALRCWADPARAECPEEGD